MAQDIMLHVKNITAGYGKLQILNGMTLQVRRGSITQSDKRRNHL